MRNGIGRTSNQSNKPSFIAGLVIGLTIVCGVALTQGIKSENATSLVAYDQSGNSFSFPASSGTVALTTDIPTLSGTTDTMAKFTGASAVGDSDLLNVGAPAAGASGNILDLPVTVNAMNGSDTVNILELDVTNANHTSTSNELNAIRIDSIVFDADAEATAIDIGTQWINTIKANNITMNTQNGTWKVINSADADVVSIDASTSGGMFVELEHNGFGVARGKIEFQSAWTASNGSDNLSFLRIDAFTDPNHTGASNSTNIIHAGAITTPDVDSQHNVLNIGDGWEFMINGDDALGTSDWSTATDKSANTAAGTIRVEINGTLYHIQLYTDS